MISKKEVSSIIEKWYKRLGFPEKYNEEFYKLLDEYDISPDIAVEGYSFEENDPKYNFFATLYMCEAMEKKVIAKGLGEDRMRELERGLYGWVVGCCNRKGALWTELYGWIRHFLRCAIFRIGRLQYTFYHSSKEIPEFDIAVGDALVGIHIPGGSKLDIEECRASLGMLEEFACEKFPEFEFKAFTCNSWLLNDELCKYLPSESNILKFASLFTIVRKYESFDILNFVFDRTVKVDNLKDVTPKNSFAARIKDAVLAGDKFYCALGVIPRK